MFQIKDFLSITASMVNYMRATQDSITDFNVGGVARTLIEAPAVELDELYQQMFNGLRDAIPVSVFNSFEYEPIPSMGSSGVVRFSASPVLSSDTAIPAGTVVMQAGGRYQYQTSVDAVLLAGASSVDVMCHCTSAGADTNINAATLTMLQAPITGVTVTNLAAFTNGTDAESDEARKARFRDFISTIARGTGAALRYAATGATVVDANGLSSERVAAIAIVEPYLVDPVTYPPALVWVYLHNGVGETSAELVANAQQIIDGYTAEDGTLVPGYKAAGVLVEVSAATDVAVDVTATITVSTTVSEAVARASATSVVASYLAGLGIGESAIQAEIIAILMGIDGVTNCAVTAPAADVTAAGNEKLLAGTLAITA